MQLRGLADADLLDESDARMAAAEQGEGCAPLNRLDWRFLLPGDGDPVRHALVLNGPPGCIAAARDAGLALSIAPSLAAAPAPLVARFATSPIPPLAAANAVAPGGLLYCEIDRSLPATLSITPVRLARSFQRAGLTTLATYWVQPSCADPKLFFPLDADADGAFAWYVTARFTPASAARAVLEAALRTTTGLRASRLSPFTRCFALIARRRAGAPGDPTPAPLALPPFAAHLGEDPYRALLLTEDRDRCILLPFAPGALEPRAVLKIAREPGLNPVIDREHDILLDLQRRCPPPLLPSIPSPLASLSYYGLAAALESYLPGPSVARSLAAWRTSFAEQQALLARTAAWIARFHQGTRLHAIWDAAAQARWLDGPCRLYQDRFGHIPSEDRLFDRARAFARSLYGLAFPLVMQHRNFAPGNILDSGAHLSVIGWEDAQVGPALCDLIQFTVDWHHTVHAAGSGKGRLDSFKQIFCASHPDAAGQAAREAISWYMSELDLDPRLLPLILLYTWLSEAPRKLRSHPRGTGQPNGCQTRNVFCAYISALAECADQLFPLPVEASRWD